MNNDINRALKPIKKGFAFMVETGTKPITHVTGTLITAPLKGLNNLVVKKINNPGVYSGARVTRTTKKMQGYFDSIPKKLGNTIRGL